MQQRMATVMAQGIIPGLALLPDTMDKPAARLQVLVTAMQESKLKDRRQIVWVIEHGQRVLRPLGPAKSLWQAELGGGMVAGVRTHVATAPHAARVYAARGIKTVSNKAIWDAIENDDVLAAALARLLVYSDPLAVPDPGNEEAAWRFYLRTWRPGAYTNGTAEKRAELRAEWSGHHRMARTFLGLL